MGHCLMKLNCDEKKTAANAMIHSLNKERYKINDLALNYQ